jgi:hypothetical protein
VAEKIGSSIETRRNKNFDLFFFCWIFMIAIKSLYSSLKGNVVGFSDTSSMGCAKSSIGILLRKKEIIDSGELVPMRTYNLACLDTKEDVTRENLEGISGRYFILDTFSS